MAEQSESVNYRVSGLTCDHCVATVRQRLGAIDGVGSVAVDLVPHGDSSVTMQLSKPVDRLVVRSELAAAGYRLVS